MSTPLHYEDDQSPQGRLLDSDELRNLVEYQRKRVKRFQNIRRDVGTLEEKLRARRQEIAANRLLQSLLVTRFTLEDNLPKK